ncbi:hypothetical protein D0Y65_038869, partial [Glycine soja]
WRRHQRMKRDAILAMQQKGGVRPSVFDRITEGRPLGFKKKISSKEQKEKKMIIHSFEFGFDDSLEAICGVISILPAQYVEDYQNINIFSDYARENYFDDPSLSPKPLHLTTMVEDQIINKILINGGAAFNILPRSMLQRFGRTVEDLIPHNIPVSHSPQILMG